MPTLPTHALVAATILTSVERSRCRWTLLGSAVTCAILPDIDVVGFSLGVRYGDLLGHRGLSHSLVFAAAKAMVAVAAGGYRKRAMACALLFACSASHGLLDAATDGGLGVAFFSPFSNQRYFLPWRPIVVSPIGLDGFFTAWGREVILTELTWIWLPCAVVLTAVWLVRPKSG